MTNRENAKTPEDLTRLFVERANAGDAEGVAALYEPGAVMAFPPGAMTSGAMRSRRCSRRSSQPTALRAGTAAPDGLCGDLALTSTPPKDGTGGRGPRSCAARPTAPGCG